MLINFKKAAGAIKKGEYDLLHVPVTKLIDTTGFSRVLSYTNLILAWAGSRINKQVQFKFVNKPQPTHLYEHGVCISILS